MPTPDPRRRIRAVLLGTALAALTVAGHTAAGGGVDGLGLVLVIIVSIALGAATSAGRARPLLILGVLAGGQALLHTVLTFTSGHSHSVTAAAVPGAVMVLGHALAAVAATVLIVHTDGITAAWVRFLSVLLGRFRPATWTFIARDQGNPTTTLVHILGSDFVSGLLARRGPPAAVPAVCMP